MNKSDNINELATALHKAQSKLDNASKNTQGHGYSYANLAEILDILTPVFVECGLSQMQIPIMQEGKACLETVIMHTSGQWISGVALMAHAKLARGNDAQMMGATIAYQRRYSLKAMVGIAEVDEEKNFKSNEGKEDIKKAKIEADLEPAKKLLSACKSYDELMKVFKAQSIAVQNSPAILGLCKTLAASFKEAK
jgi:hypothetical protein